MQSVSRNGMKNNPWDKTVKLTESCNWTSCEIGTSQRGPEPWNTEAEDIVEIRCQATPSKDIEDLQRAIVRSKVPELAIAL
jgi:hypothetical protein